MTTLYDFISNNAGWPIMALLLVAMFLLREAFAWREKKLGAQNKVLDARFWYSPADVKQLMEGLKPAGRRLYAITQVTLDLLFPLVYGYLFAGLIVHLHGADAARLLLLLPLLAVSADILENTTSAYLALSYRGTESRLAWFTAICTALKFLFFSVSIVVIVVGSIRGLA